MKTKTLYFEGAGTSFNEQADKDNSDVGNHRIRTAFHNDEGTPIYLEIFHSRVEKKDKRSFTKGFQPGQLIAWVDHCFIPNTDELPDTKTPREHNTLPCERNVRFLYTLDEIKKFVNENLGCSFDKVEVLDDLEWYYVHSGDREQPHNFMEDHEVNPARTEARNNLKKHLTRYYNDKFGTKWPPFSVSKVDGDNMSIHIYASEQAMEKAGIKLRNIDYTIEGWYKHVTQ